MHVCVHIYMFICNAIAGKFDEDFRPRPNVSIPGVSRCHVLQDVLEHPGLGRVMVLDDELRRYAFRGYHDKEDDEAIAAAITPPKQVCGYCFMFSACTADFLCRTNICLRFLA